VENIIARKVNRVDVLQDVERGEREVEVEEIVDVLGWV
jgi:hypothetical protein